MVTKQDLMKTYKAEHAFRMNSEQLGQVYSNALRINARLDQKGRDLVNVLPGQRIVLFDDKRLALVQAVAGRRFSGIKPADLPNLSYIGFERAHEPIIVPSREGPNVILAQDDTMNAILAGERVDLRPYAKMFEKGKIINCVGIGKGGVATKKAAVLKVVKTSPANMDKHYTGYKLADPISGTIFGWKAVLEKVDLKGRVE